MMDQGQRVGRDGIQFDGMLLPMEMLIISSC